jgi:alternate signal-mediated exported protein
MNKLIKGAVTGAAGIALLLGGAGSFAAWNSSASVLPGAGTAIHTGTLSVSAPSDKGTWTSLTTKKTIDPATYQVVPGETIEYTQTVTLTASGDALTASLGFTNPTLKNGTAVDESFSAATKIVGALPDGVVDNGDKTYTIKPSAATAAGTPLTIALDITFSGNATGDQLQTISLTDTTLTVSETAPASAK